MPTEHEYKYVISLDLLAQYPEEQLRVLCDRVVKIQQGYLAFAKGMSQRIRTAQEFGRDKWILTFKQKVAKRVVEIEKKLDDRDGNDLWEVALSKVKKDRHVFNHDGIAWELDLFKFDNEVYFIMAEVELLEGAARPKMVLSLLRNFVVYEVPLTDDRFSSKRLADVNYAKQLYQQLITGDKDVRQDRNEALPEGL